MYCVHVNGCMYALSVGWHLAGMLWCPQYMISPVHAMYMCMYSVHTTVTVLVYVHVHVLVLSETWMG